MLLRTVKLWTKNKLRQLSRFAHFSRFGVTLYAILVQTDGEREQPEFVTHDTEPVVYLVMSKVACSSIKKTFVREHVNDDYSIHARLRSRRGEQNGEAFSSSFKFTFVRNPFDRLVSCYVSKFMKDRDRIGVFIYDNYPYGGLRLVSSFADFVRRVACIPDELSDRHFRSQYSLVFRHGHSLVDLVGRFETLNEEFALIRRRYRLEPLPHFNRSQVADWREYYTPELADLVYERYRRDFEEWYPDAHAQLHRWLKLKSTSSHAEPVFE